MRRINEQQKYSKDNMEIFLRKARDREIAKMADLTELKKLGQSPDPYSINQMRLHNDMLSRNIKIEMRMKNYSDSIANPLESRVKARLNEMFSREVLKNNERDKKLLEKLNQNGGALILPKQRYDLNPQRYFEHSRINNTEREMSLSDADHMNRVPNYYTRSIPNLNYSGKSIEPRFRGPQRL